MTPSRSAPHMGSGLPGAPGALAQAPATVDPKCQRKHGAAHALRLSPPSSPQGSPAQGQPMKSGAALACHPAQWLGVGDHGAL